MHDAARTGGEARALDRRAKTHAALGLHIGPEPADALPAGVMERCVGPLLDLQACAVATGPLPDDLLAELGGVSVPQVIGAGELAPHWRITGDNRLILGGGRPLDVRGLSPARRATLLERTWRSLENTVRASPAPHRPRRVIADRLGWRRRRGTHRI